MVDRVARDTLAQQIATQLEIGQQYTEHVDPADADHIALIRAAGRAAGRMLGWKVRTFETDPAKRADGLVVVWVVVVGSTPEDEARFKAQGDLLMRDAMTRMMPDGL